MQAGERNPSIIADAAHDQMVADQQRIFHRARGNHASLADRSVDEQKYQPDPEPRDDFAPDLLLHAERFQLYFFLAGFFLLQFRFFNLHVPPLRLPVSPACRFPRPLEPQDARGGWGNSLYNYA